MNNWMRPSMQQSRWISNYVKFVTAPLVVALEVQRTFWQTWHAVYLPERKEKDINV